MEALGVILDDMLVESSQIMGDRMSKNLFILPARSRRGERQRAIQRHRR